MRSQSKTHLSLRWSIILKLSRIVKLNNNILKDKDPSFSLNYKTLVNAQKIMKSRFIVGTLRTFFNSPWYSRMESLVFITNYKYYILRGRKLSKYFYGFYFRIRSEGIWHWHIIKWLIVYSNGCGLLPILCVKGYISYHTYRRPVIGKLR